MFVISGVRATSKVYCISKGKRYFSGRSSTYYFQIKTKILADFQICISVPLIGFSGSTSTTTHFSITMKQNILVINCMSRSCFVKKISNSPSNLLNFLSFFITSLQFVPENVSQFWIRFKFASKYSEIYRQSANETQK